MTEEVKQEVELHNESVNDEIVEETLVDESTAPMPKGKPDANATDEEESIASVDKAAKAKSEGKLRGYNENLPGNQEKLDTDKDGEIEASDLAALRNKK